MTTKTNLVLDQGADFIATFSLKDANNQPLDVIGYMANSAMRKYITSNTAYTFDTELSTGQVIIRMNAATSSSIEYGRYYYDVKLTDTISNVVSRVVQGIVFVDPEITK